MVTGSGMNRAMVASGHSLAGASRESGSPTPPKHLLATSWMEALTTFMRNASCAWSGGPAWMTAGTAISGTRVYRVIGGTARRNG